MLPFVARSLPSRQIQRLLALLLILSLVSVSSPNVTAEVAAHSIAFYREVRFAALSAPRISAAESMPFLSGISLQTPQDSVARIDIFPGPVTLSQYSKFVFAAVAYNAAGEQLSGVAFQWSVEDSEQRFPSRGFEGGFFNAELPGTLFLD